MYIDPDVYKPEMLNDDDKAKFDVIDETTDNILSADVIEDFIETREISGETIQQIYREVLTSFVSYLRERTEYCKVDFLIETIECYPEEEVKRKVTAFRAGKKKKES